MSSFSFRKKNKPRWRPLKPVIHFDAAFNMIAPGQRPSKRQRMEQPPSWMDIESLQHVLVHHGTDPSSNDHVDSNTQNNNNNNQTLSPFFISYHRTSICKMVAGDIFLDRWFKEVCQACHLQFGQKQPSLMPHETQDQALQRVAFCKQIIGVGINQVTKFLQEMDTLPTMNKTVSNTTSREDPSPSPSAGTAVLLVMMVHPSHTSTAVLPWQHIVVACARRHIPLVLLPAGLERRLGQTLGNIRRASCVALCRRRPTTPAATTTTSNSHLDKDESSSVENTMTASETRALEKCLEDFVDYVTNDFLKHSEYFE